MLKIISVRHLPTQLNVNGIIQGRLDNDISTLTSEISVSIEKNIVVLNELGSFDRVFSSTLRRTISTAQIYGYPDAIENTLLDELDFGIYEGKRKTRMETALMNNWYDNPQTLSLGETLLDFQHRILQFINSCRDLNNILFFGHGAWIRALLSLATHGDISNMNRIDVLNNSISIVHIDTNDRTYIETTRRDQ